MAADQGAGGGADLVAADAGIAAAVACALRRPARLGGTRLVAVDGPSGSGKTSLAGPLARTLADAVGGVVITLIRSEVPDRSSSHATSAPPLYLPRDTGQVQSGRKPQVAILSTDLLASWEQPLQWWPTLEEHLLAPLAAGTTARMPVVEWVAGNPRPGGSISVPPVDVLVLEGVSSGRRAVAGRLSALVWVEVVDRAVRLERAVARDGAAMRPYLLRWQVDEAAHFAADGTRKRADVVITR